MASESRTGTESELELGRWIGARIRSIRTLKSMTQEDLAQKMGTQRPAVSNWENGINIPSLPTLAKLAEIFSVPIRRLLEDTDDTPDEMQSSGGAATERPGLERWMDLFVELGESNSRGQELLNTTMHLLGRLSAIAESPRQQPLFHSLADSLDRSFSFVSDLLVREDHRRVQTFLREIGLNVQESSEQSRYAHISELFVAPAGFDEQLAHLAVESNVLLITGPKHSGKTFTGLHMLMDLAEMSFRPHFLPGSVSAPLPAAEDVESLECYLRHGQAVLCDDVFARGSGSVPIRQVCADPHAAVALARRHDTRLIVTVDDQELAEHPELRDAFEPHIWSLADAYDKNRMSRMVLNYSEVYHPGAREPIAISPDGLDNPHSVERALAIPSDNRQTIRRRSAGVRRDGIEGLLIEDLSVLEAPRLALLLIAHFVPLDWGRQRALYDSLRTRGVGGESVAAESALLSLEAWLYSIGRNGDRRISLCHPSYGAAIDRALHTSTDLQEVVLRLIARLAAGDVFEQQIGADICGRLPDDARPKAVASLGQAGSLSSAVAAALGAESSLKGSARFSLPAVLGTPLGLRYAAWARWFTEQRSVLNAKIAAKLEWLDSDSTLANLVRAQGGSPEALKSQLAELTSEAAPETLAFAAQIAAEAVGNAPEDQLVDLLHRLSLHADPGVAQSTRRTLLDGINLVPPDARRRLLNTP